MSDRRIPFTSEDEDRIAGASLWGIIVAVTGIVSSAVTTVVAWLSVPRMEGVPHRGTMVIITGTVIQTLALLFSIALGIWLIQASLAFRAVARTDVADKAFLLRGFNRLHKYFLAIGIVLIVVLVALALLMVVALLA